MKMYVNFQPDVESAIRAEAERLGIPMSDVVRSCVEEVLLSRDRTKIGVTTARLIRDGLSNDDVLAGVRREHGPHASSLASVAWYRSSLRRGDSTVLGQRQARRLKDRSGA
jgi:hypothetical protein